MLHLLFCFRGPWWDIRAAPSPCILKMPIIAPPITDIHRASNNNTTTRGSEANRRDGAEETFRSSTSASLVNGITSKSASHIMQATRESRAFVIPKNIPQKRLHESVVKGIRLNSSASKGPTSSAGHNTSSGSALKTKTSC